MYFVEFCYKRAGILRNTIKLLYVQNSRLWNNAETQINEKRKIVSKEQHYS